MRVFRGLLVALPPTWRRIDISPPCIASFRVSTLCSFADAKSPLPLETPLEQLLNSYKARNRSLIWTKVDPHSFGPICDIRNCLPTFARWKDSIKATETRNIVVCVCVCVGVSSSLRDRYFR